MLETENREFCLKTDIKKKLRQFELNVDFAAGTGCLGILGPSGCGKSMTLKSIAGIVQPDSGRISLESRGCDGTIKREEVLFDTSKRINVRPQKRRVGYLFQSYALFPNMTVKQNIAVGLKKEKNADKVISEMIERFRLNGLENQYPGQLSGGQQQRVALARMLAYEPQVLLLDEPFSAMDSYLREGLRLELASVLSEYPGISVMVTHDRDEAYQLCDSLLLLNDGKVMASGKTRDVFADPVTVQAARLTGCKNISRIERLGDHKVKALDWNGLELVTEETVGDEITSIGIRAHDFEALSQSQWEELSKAGSVNLIPVENPKVSEMPFEWYVTLENGLWWKKEKGIHTHDSVGVVPAGLRVEPSALLLLKES